MVQEEIPSDVRLHRIEYLEDEIRVVDWVWLTEHELGEYLDFKSEYFGLIHRVATSDEEELYDEAYRDGYEISVLQDISENDNGVTFRMDGIGLDDNIETTKMFRCAKCNEHKDFETDVAVANGFYVALAKKDVLWHVCFICAISELEVD